MAGDYPALHWWPTIITAWAVGLLILAFTLKMSRDKDKGRLHVAVELFSSVSVILTGSVLILGVSTWLGLLGQLSAVAIVGIPSLYLFRGPAWTRRTALLLHAGLVVGLLTSHLYFSAVQSKEGKLRYGLQYGSGASALKPRLKAVPLAELLQLTEKSMREGEGAKVLSEIINERSPELYDLKDSELEALSREPMSDPMRKSLVQLLQQRRSREPRSR